MTIKTIELNFPNHHLDKALELFWVVFSNKKKSKIRATYPEPEHDNLWEDEKAPGLWKMSLSGPEDVIDRLRPKEEEGG